MSLRNLDALFEPKSVAVIGASNRPRSVGSLVMRNMLTSGFEGPVMPVNPKAGAIHGVYAYPDIASLPVTPDLAVICIPPKAVCGAIDELGARGTRAAVVLTAGLNLDNARAEDGRTFQVHMVEIARKYGMRILGPNCIGMMAPGIGLSAGFLHANAKPGKIAFVSQSGGMTTGVLDYANTNGIGFSHFLSLGDIVDVDFSDVLEYLGSDPEVSAIMLYVEMIHNAREFMTAARAAARNKPVLVVKSGRVAEGARAAISHTGAMAGSDDVYEAAFRRAGTWRVYTITELFDSVQTLARAKDLKGDKLAILTNGGGPGVIAVDALIKGGGKLASLSDETIEKLNAVLPTTWSHDNPVDIVGDAPRERYADSLKVLLQAPEIDAVLVMHVITAVADTNETARGVVEMCKDARKTVLTSWLGAETVRQARQLFAEAGIPTYSTPDRAVRTFLNMVGYRHNQESLMETPRSVSESFTPDVEKARAIVKQALAEERYTLSEPEAKAVLGAYGVPVVRTEVARTPEEAAAMAEDMGYPVVLKIISPQITHKSDVGGVALNLKSKAGVEHTAREMLVKVAQHHPDAELLGFSVQQMAERAGAHELIVGVATDQAFGPVILFGQGGKAVEVISDRAVGLPPLNMALAKDLVSQTRVWKLLQGYRDEPAADIDAICLTLIKISQLVTDLGEVAELDINPLFADARGVLALDARITVKACQGSGADRLAIHPYPSELEESLKLADGLDVRVRPIRPEDEPEHHVFISKLSPEDIRYRFFGMVREIPHSQMARLTQIDYDREMAFIAQLVDAAGETETIGVVRAAIDPDNERGEFAIVIRSDMKGKGLGRALMAKMIGYLRGHKVQKMVGQVLPDNKGMLALAERLGFVATPVLDGEAFEVTLDLS